MGFNAQEWKLNKFDIWSGQVLLSNLWQDADLFAKPARTICGFIGSMILRVSAEAWAIIL
jgi:hypothetical protein